MSGGLRLPKFLEKMWWRGRKNLTQKLRCTCTRRWLTAGSWRRSSTLSMKTSSTCQASNSQKMWFVEQYVELLLHVKCLTWTVCEVDICIFDPSNNIRNVSLMFVCLISPSHSGCKRGILFLFWLSSPDYR